MNYKNLILLTVIIFGLMLSFGCASNDNSKKSISSELKPTPTLTPMPIPTPKQISTPTPVTTPVLTPTSSYQPTQKTSTSKTMYYASSKSGKYHLFGCRYVDNIKPENLITFKSKQEAESAGYEPCSVCNP